MDAGGQTRQERDPSVRKGELHQLHREPQHQSLCGGKGSARDNMADQALMHRAGACLEEEQAGKATIAAPPQNKQPGE